MFIKREGGGGGGGLTIFENCITIGHVRHIIILDIVILQCIQSSLFISISTYDNEIFSKHKIIVIN